MNRVAPLLALGVVTTSLASGCGGAPAAALPPQPRGQAGGLAASDAAAVFTRLEGSLLRGTAPPIAFRITAEGAFTADLRGELRLGPGDDAALAAAGTFGEDSVMLSLTAADGVLTGGNGDRRFEQATPPALREALALGLTRMGLLHNLARLVSGSPPDGADGTFPGRVQARNHAWTAREGQPPRHGIAFEVWVQGQHTADAVLWLDAVGRPVVREQTVRFPGGEMRVRESYEPGGWLPGEGP